MSFTNDNNLEQPANGSADWDTGLNSNFSVLERGQHFRATAGMEINSGEAIILTGSGTAVRYDASSSGNGDINGVSYSNVSSGAEGFFPHIGIIRSLDVNTFAFEIGKPVFVSSQFPGLLVSSDGGNTSFAAGTAVDTNALIVSPFRIADSAQSDTLILEYALDAETSVATIGTRLTTRARQAFTMTSVRMSLTEPSTSGLFNVSVLINSGNVLSTNLTVDATERTSVTAAAAAVVDANSNSVADDDQISFLVNSAGAGAIGPKIAIYGTPV